MINQLGKFSSCLAELSQPLRELLSKKRSWTRGPNQELAFSELKTELTRPTVLALLESMTPKQRLRSLPAHPHLGLVPYLVPYIVYLLKRDCFEVSEVFNIDGLV